MDHNKFLYTDGRDVIVTQSILQTKKAAYRLKGITDFGLAILKPKHILEALLLLLGLTIAADGYYHFIPVAYFQALYIPDEYATSTILIPIGACIATMGIVFIILIRKKYALRIETAEGKKDAVVSSNKQYVNQILAAVRKAKSAFDYK